MKRGFVLTVKLIADKLENRYQNKESIVKLSRLRHLFHAPWQFNSMFSQLYLNLDIYYVSIA